MAATEPEYGNCQACKTPLQYLGLEQFRIGGTSGAAKLFFGELAELGEGMLPLYLFLCPYCRRVELRAPEKSH